MKISTINPATEEVLNTYLCADDAQINKLVENSFQAFKDWKCTSFSERSALMSNLAQVLLDKKEELSLLMTREMGKPLKASESEIEKCSLLSHHYAEHAQGYLEARYIEIPRGKAKICHLPLGVIFGIMPWNFPFWQVFRFAVPTIMAGNTVLLKHAPNTTGTGCKIEELFLQAGFPLHVFQHIIVTNEGAAKVIAEEHIAGVTLTGSERAGRAVAALAGQHLKKSMLELGGSDPYVVLDDADLDLAAECIVASRLNNSGQVCIAAKRVIAIRSIHDRLVDKIQQNIKKYTMGHPELDTTQLGPLARKDLRDTVHLQVQKSIKSGANLCCGGIIPSGKGFYYPATLLTQVTQSMPAFDEELFGPVIAMISAENEKEAIVLANHSPFGLGAAVFTQDLTRGELIATDEIEAGSCYVNSMVVSDPALPFGGVKHSGYGRELSKEGILEFVNVKTIVVR